MHKFWIKNWGKKNFKFFSVYRSPSQNGDEFEKFLENLELSIDHMADKNLYMMVLLRDFNARLNPWYANDNTNFEEWIIDILSASFSFNQIVNEPTHILNISSSCIDLIFTSQPNLVIESSVHSSLHVSCHHQTAYAKFNLNVTYPPIYERDVWHYKLANWDFIQRSIANFNWEIAFHNVAVKKQVMLFNKTAFNIIRNFIPHEPATFDDRDPPWITSHIKRTSNDKNLAFKRFVNKKGFVNNSRNVERLSSLQNNMSNLNETSKQEYLSKITKRYLILVSVQKHIGLF